MSPRTTNTNSKKWSTACGITFLFLLGCSVSRWLDVSWDAPFDQSRLLLLLNNFTVDSNTTTHHLVHLEATVTSEALLRRRRRPSNNYTRINSNNRTEDPANSTATIHNNNNNNNNSSNNKRQQRILYTITTLKEYNDGTRSTHKDSDRYQDTLIPIVVQGVQSMLDHYGYYYYDVDVYLICAFVLTPERQQLLRDKLPSRVGLEVWDDALPLAYSVKDLRKNSSIAKLTNHSRGLARQHRFVLKDKLLHYDVFVNFEDDMLVKGEHVQNYVAMTNHLQALRTQAPREDDDALKDLQTNNITASSLITYNPLLRYFGTMTQRQLSQIIPGFIRVEVVLNETQTPIPPLSVKVPVDLDHIVPSSSDAFQDSNHPHYHHRNYFRKSSDATSRILHDSPPPSPEDLVDPSPCCHVSPNVTTELLVQPTLHQLMVWETQIVALGVRQMPSLLLGNHTTTYNNESYPLDWVVLQRGTPSHQGIPDYWSGNTGYYQNDTVHWRPDASERKYINNMGGYIATQQQLLEWHLDTCPSGFLPPFDGSSYGDMDGLDLRDVEFWSGGIQLISQCGLTRAINLDPRYFGRHLLYHTANNKQVQLQHVKERFTRADDLYGMLTTTRKHAERTQERLWQNATTDHNVTHCIQESPHCFPPSNRRGKCNIETAMACLLPLGNESIPENASV